MVPLKDCQLGYKENKSVSNLMCRVDSKSGQVNKNAPARLGHSI